MHKKMTKKALYKHVCSYIICSHWGLLSYKG